VSEANSPLRYPGGKAVLADFLGATIEANGIRECVYAEPYAGGAGAAINLLLEGKVERVILNDADRNVWAFWRAVLDRTNEFLAMVDKVPVTVDEWRRQREVYQSRRGSILAKGFAAFFLNRCNRSGILTNGGVIGGLTQQGKWKIDARYNRIELRRRIERIAAYAENIVVTNLDALYFLKTHVISVPDRERFFVYLDPPYYVKGSELYLNYYEPKDHTALAKVLRKIRDVHWLVTYDNVPEIQRLYAWGKVEPFSLRYSAHTSRDGGELVISNHGLNVPVDALRACVGTRSPAV
jgi:DNA adenine methylase